MTGKDEIRDFWNSHPCGTQFADMGLESRDFFEQVARYRYQVQPFMARIAEFNRFFGKRVLEVGCGLGTDLLRFAMTGAFVSAIDLTGEAIRLVNKRFSLYSHLEVDARVGDAENLPWVNDSFDLVYSFGVLHHTPDTQRAINEAWRVLKWGGQVTVMLYYRYGIEVFEGILKGRSPSEAVRLYDGPENPLGKSYSRRQVRQMFSQFRNVTLETVEPIRPEYPKFVNSILQRLAPFIGSWLIIKGTK